MSAPFKNEKFLSAWEKEALLADWQRFIEHGFRWPHFTGKLYEYLSLQCGFAAHTSHRRFWETYFNSKAAALAVFVNQFGGTKVSAESRWIDWRNGNTADLKEAMITAAEKIWPFFASALIAYALEHYESEKWKDAQERVAQLPPEMQNAQMLGVMGAIIELVSPFEAHLYILPVNDDLRTHLDMSAAAIVADDPDPVFDFGELPAAPIAAVRHLSLFEADTRQHRQQNAALNQKIAALSQAAVVALAEKYAATPTVIEGEKAIPLRQNA